MTLLDLWRLARRYWILVVALALVGCVAGGAYAKMAGSSSSATAYVIANSQTDTVVSIATAEGARIAAAAAEDGAGSYSASAKKETNTTSVAIAVSGPDASVCIDLANKAAEATKESARALYRDSIESKTAIAFDAQVVPAETAASVSKSVKKFGLVGLIAGLFVALCAVVLVDMLRRPLKSAEDAQEVAGLPVLEALPSKDEGARLLANVRFAGGNDDPRNVCVVPAGSEDDARAVARAIADAMGQEGLECQVRAAADPSAPADDVIGIRTWGPLSAGMEGAYAARDADVSVVAVALWRDSAPQLESTVAELELAGAKVAGLVLVGQARA